jgi:hypothetical protein
MKQLLFVACALLMSLGSGLAQNAPKPANAGMSVADVQDMVKAGLSEDLVIAALRKDNKKFDLGAQDMLQLKKAGVSDNIIKVMLDPSAPVASPAAQALAGGVVGIRPARASGATPDAGVSEAAIEANVNNPEAPHDSGIYLFAGDKMTELERAAPQGTKTGMLGHVLTYGIVKGKTKAVLPGPRASIRTGEERPVFYFYFEDKSAALGKTGFGAQTVSNPNQFSLLKLDQKKDSREVVIGTIGFASTSTGNESKSEIAFKSDKIRPGVYRVIPTANMEPGEYCFASASTSGAAHAADLFDFSINPNQ